MNKVTCTKTPDLKHCLQLNRLYIYIFLLLSVKRQSEPICTLLIMFILCKLRLKVCHIIRETATGADLCNSWILPANTVHSIQLNLVACSCCTVMHSYQELVYFLSWLWVYIFQTSISPHACYLMLRVIFNHALVYRHWQEGNATSSRKKTNKL